MKKKGKDRRFLLFAGFKKRNKLKKRYEENKLIYDFSEDKKQIFYTSNDWRLLREWAKQRYAERCVCCANTSNLQLDHIEPITINPKKCLTFLNVQWLCKTCNKLKSNRSNVRMKRRYRDKSIMPCPIAVKSMEQKWEIYFPMIQQIPNENHLQTIVN